MKASWIHQLVYLDLSGEFTPLSNTDYWIWITFAIIICIIILVLLLAVYTRTLAERRS
jgi:hypothetical protein